MDEDGGNISGNMLKHHHKPPPLPRPNQTAAAAAAGISVDEGASRMPTSCTTNNIADATASKPAEKTPVNTTACGSSVNKSASKMPTYIRGNGSAVASASKPAEKTPVKTTAGGSNSVNKRARKTPTSCTTNDIAAATASKSAEKTPVKTTAVGSNSVNKSASKMPISIRENGIAAATASKPAEKTPAKTTAGGSISVKMPTSCTTNDIVAATASRPAEKTPVKTTAVGSNSVNKSASKMPTSIRENRIAAATASKPAEKTPAKTTAGGSNSVKMPTSCTTNDIAAATADFPAEKTPVKTTVVGSNSVNKSASKMPTSIRENGSAAATTSKPAEKTPEKTTAGGSNSVKMPTFCTTNDTAAATASLPAEKTPVKTTTVGSNSIIKSASKMPTSCTTNDIAAAASMPAVKTPEKTTAGGSNSVKMPTSCSTNDIAAAAAGSLPAEKTPVKSTIVGSNSVNKSASKMPTSCTTNDIAAVAVSMPAEKTPVKATAGNSSVNKSASKMPISTRGNGSAAATASKPAGKTPAKINAGDRSVNKGAGKSPKYTPRKIASPDATASTAVGKTPDKTNAGDRSVSKGAGKSPKSTPRRITSPIATASKSAGKTPVKGDSGSGVIKGTGKSPKSENTCLTATASTPATAFSRTPKAKNRSAWAASSSIRRKPPEKPFGKPKPKAPLPAAARGSAATKVQGQATVLTTEGEMLPPSPLTSKSPGMKRGKVAESWAPEETKVEKEEDVPACFGPLATRTLPPRVSAVVPWEKRLRRRSKTPPGKKISPEKKNALNPGLRKGAKAHGARGGISRKGGGGGGGGVGDDGSGSGRHAADGRPSVGTWTRCRDYLQILKEISGKDDEELAWLADAKKGQGFQRSEERRESAETAYHRLLFQESVEQAGLKLLQDRRLEVSLRAVSKMGDELERLSELLEELSRQERDLIVEDQEAGEEDGEAASSERRQLVGRLKGEREDAEAGLYQVLDNIAKGKANVQAVREALTRESGAVARGCDGDDGDALTTIIGVTANVISSRELITPARATNGLRTLEHAAASLRQGMAKTRSDAQAALARMEKWRERQEALPGYEKEVAQKERAWFVREKEANDQALRRMRALCPVGVTSLTVQGLEQRAIEAGSLYPRQLSLRLKENRLLHWTIEHPADIARSSFLRGDHAHFFTNLDRYDLVELRSVTACLPERFEVDGDGRKAAWRAAFLQRVQGLVAQERGETVSGGWDPEIGARRAVRLPELAAEQIRRPEYFYPTRQEREKTMAKLVEREKRVETKRLKLAEVRDVLLPDARDEYTNVLEDTRHPANREAFTAEELRRARDKARAEVDRLARESKRLEAEVATAERALKDAPYTVESLRAEEKATRALLVDRAEKRRLLMAKDEQKDQEGHGETAGVSAEDGGSGEDEGLEVEGPFDPKPELKSRFGDKSSSLKFVTAEEDARMRREELAKVFGDREAAGARAGMGAGLPSIGEDRAPEEETCDDKKRSGPAKSANAGEGTAEKAEGLARAGAASGRIKAFSAILETTLTKGMATDSPVCRRDRAVPFAQSSPENQRILSPPCAPKSKLFRSILSPTKGDAESGAGSMTARPSPPMVTGLLSQIRARDGGGGGGDDVGSDGVKKVVIMGGLLSQIRARGGGRADASVTATGKEGHADWGSTNETPLMPPPPPPLARTLLLPNSGSDSGGVGGRSGFPPPNLFAEIRAKAKGAISGDHASLGLANATSLMPPPPPLTRRPLLPDFGSDSGGDGGRSGLPLPSLFAEIRAKAAKRAALRGVADT